MQLVEGRCRLEQTQSRSPAGEQTTAILEEERTFPDLSSQHFLHKDLELELSSSAPAWSGCTGHYLSSAQVPLDSLCPQLPGSFNKYL